MAVAQRSDVVCKYYESTFPNSNLEAMVRVGGLSILEVGDTTCFLSTRLLDDDGVARFATCGMSRFYDLLQEEFPVGTTSAKLFFPIPHIPIPEERYCCEMVLSTSSTADAWPMVLLNFLMTTKYENPIPPFCPGDKVPFPSSMFLPPTHPMRDTATIQGFLLAPLPSWPSLVLESGTKMVFVALVGITQEELEWANRHSGKELSALLLKNFGEEGMLVTNLQRQSIPDVL